MYKFRPCKAVCLAGIRLESPETIQSARSLRLDLGHGGTGAASAAKGAAHLLEGEEEAAAEGGKEEPHEGVAGLELAAAVLGVVGAVADPGGVAAPGLGAVGVADAGGEDNGADEGEEDAEAVEGGEDDGLAEAGDDGGDHAVEADDPGEGGDEHGEVYGGAGSRGGANVLGDYISDEAGDDDCEDEGDAAQDEVNEARHGDAGRGVIVCDAKVAVGDAAVIDQTPMPWCFGATGSSRQNKVEKVEDR